MICKRFATTDLEHAGKQETHLAMTKGRGNSRRGIEELGRGGTKKRVRGLVLEENERFYQEGNGRIYWILEDEKENQL